MQAVADALSLLANLVELATPAIETLPSSFLSSGVKYDCGRL
jgi:hypothetical protein